MDPRSKRSSARRPSFPRARGDGPATATSRRPKSLLPPRSRGWTHPALAVGVFDAASPALAGMDLSSVPSVVFSASFPRARGDGPMADGVALFHAKLPPRSRGWTLIEADQIPADTASPALAGMDPTRSRLPTSTASFPRARGDGPDKPIDQPLVQLLPPRSRGWTHIRKNRPIPDHASPALAGMDLQPCLVADSRLRFPRARGDGPVRAGYFTPTKRLPPRSRGWTRPRRLLHADEAASPALAGMDPAPPTGSHCSPGFPRARGDGPAWQRTVEDARKLPPRSRGWTVGSDASRSC